MKRNKTLVAVTAIGLAITGAWLLGWFDGKPSEVAELEKLRDENFARRKEMSESDRQEARSEFRERVKELPEDQRKAFFESSMPVFLKMFEYRVDQFLVMPPEQQKEELDKRIDQMQARREQGEQRKPPSADQMDEFRKKMLDWTTPAQRAKFEKALGMLGERMEERGLDPLPGGGFF